MKLSTRSRYGARILVDLARHTNQGPVQIGEISKRQDISVKYLEQLIRPLKQASMVNSVRGPKGAPRQGINLVAGWCVLLLAAPWRIDSSLTTPDGHLTLGCPTT